MTMSHVYKICQLASPNQLPLNWLHCVVLHHLPLLSLLHLFCLHFPLILLLASFIYAYIQSPALDSIYKLYSSNSISPQIFRRDDNKTIFFIISFLLSLKIYLHTTTSSQLDSSHINKHQGCFLGTRMQVLSLNSVIY